MSFNDGTKLDPSRIQRRGRGTGKGGVAAGGGILGVILLVIYLFMGGDVSDIGGLGGDGAAGDSTDLQQQADFDARCVTGASADEYADCRVLAVIESLDAYWKDAMGAVGETFTLPGVVVFDDTTSSACGTASSATGPFYCPTDETLYIDTTFFASLEQFGYEGGNLAEAYVVAHEYGHHIENNLGIFAFADRTETGPDSDTVKVELMADCLAGVWVNSAATTLDPDTGEAFLEPVTREQLDNALNAAASVGDDRIQETINGEVDPHTFTHGSSQERSDAFMDGYYSGDINKCDAFGVVRNS